MKTQGFIPFGLSSVQIPVFSYGLIPNSISVSIAYSIAYSYCLIPIFCKFPLWRVEDRAQDLLDRISVETALRDSFTRISVEYPVQKILYRFVRQEYQTPQTSTK